MQLYLFYFAVFIGIIPLLVFIIRRKSLTEVSAIEPFLWLIVISGFYELIGTLLFSLPTDPWFRTYCLMEFAAVFYFFYTLLKDVYRLVLLISGSLYLLLYVLLLFFWDNWDNLITESYLSIFIALFVFCCSVLWFKNIFSSMSESSLVQSPLFYFISGFILYFSGTLFLFLVSSLMVKNTALSLGEHWILIIIFNIILRILLIIGIWKALRKSVQYSG